MTGFPHAEAMLGRMWSAVGGDPDAAAAVRFTGERVLPSCYPMSDLGAAAFAAAGLAVAELAALADPRGRELRTTPPTREVVVDRTLCTGWFHRASRPVVAGPGRRSPFHAMSRDFPTADGRWLRFQANYPHLRRAALAVLGAEPDGTGVAEVVRAHAADELEAAVVAGGGAAAATRTAAEWYAHPQGRAIAAEPLVTVDRLDRLDCLDQAAGTAGAAGTDPGPGAASPGGSGTAGVPGSGSGWVPVVRERPLAGLRVLDLTRVLAGPLAGRFLAACGAEVLRIDAPDYAEPTGVGDLTLGKRCAVLDLADARGRDRFRELLAGADVLVHGLRPGALDGLGLGRRERLACRPDLVEVTLDAYGWTGPWRGRRGFDTLVQASCGMALAGGEWAGTDHPHRWPLSILDHAAGYLMAAAAIRAVTDRVRGAGGSVSRLSLAAVAHLLMTPPVPPVTSAPQDVTESAFQSLRPTERRFQSAAWGGGSALELPLDGPVDPTVHAGADGPVRRLVWPLAVGGVAFGWDRPADPYGSSTPTWLGSSVPL